MSGGNTGVKNLRAMFENKTTDQPTSPPSRGRSPNGSISSVNSRPVSKVRASFVAVERSGEAGQPSQWGLRKTSDVSSMAEVREEALHEEQMARQSGISGSASPVLVQQADLGIILKGSPFEDTFRQAPILAKTESVQKEKTPTTGKVNGSTNTVAALASKIQGQAKNDKTETNIIKPSKTAPKPSPNLPSDIDTKAATAKPKESQVPPKKSPVLQKKTQEPEKDNANGTTNPVNSGPIKPRGGISKIQGVMASAQKAKEERAKPVQQSQAPPPAQPQPAAESGKEIKAPSVAQKQTVASKAHIQKSDGAHTSDATQSKQSVSKPTKLPAVATASTAAFSARKDKDESKAAASDRRSTLPHAPRVANISTKAALAKKNSRTSLASGEDRSKSRQSTTFKPADEGFLARMTRPTASSAQKAHAKVEVPSPSRPRQASTSTSVPRKSSKKTESVTSRDHNETLMSIAANESDLTSTMSESTHVDLETAEREGSNDIAEVDQEVPTASLQS